MKSELILPEVEDYLRNNINLDIRNLALKNPPFPGLTGSELARQLLGLQKAREKLPSWFETRGIIYPARRALEQCSSEFTGRYKMQICGTVTSLWDLTGGSGVDTFFLGREADEVDYVEPDEALHALSLHNLNRLGIPKVRSHIMDARTFLTRNEGVVDLAYIDPDRRKEDGNRAILWMDCKPDLQELLPLLEGRARRILIKASPILDILRGGRELLDFTPHFGIEEIHIVSHRQEVKELLYLLSPSPSRPLEQVPLVTAEIDPSQAFEFRFNREEESAARANYAGESPDALLFDPHPALKKASAFQLIGCRYGLHKLHPHTHLYTAAVPGTYPGRLFRIRAVYPPGSDQLKEWKNRKANVVVRNYPSGVEQIRKKYRIREGGSHYLFFCTLGPDLLRVLEAERLD